MSVKVGVRVRPFNQRESDLNCELCVDMIGNMTRLIDPENPDKHRDFTFDYSFWSHDQFIQEENGYLKPQTEKYADQQKVYEKVGVEILDNAWEGYHCCLFAYGQTGSGKSYSMVGYGTNKGIVPISCNQIFRRIQANDNKDKEYEVNVSMLEIYNEKVQDLLVPINKRAKDGYKIREHKTLGIYVEGLSKHYMDTYEAIEKKMEEGSRNRSIAATEMNASSSRAHTIISIEFRQKEVISGKKREKLSVIHLVDLAGSEKVGKTGATGDRLKEAAGINKSLSALGLVISSLADIAMGKGKGVVVPYRTSCLTRILQNALGGNSKTLMICAISPATDNYQETLSTLRYADQAKKIQNKAVVNESETDKMIRNLTEEKNDLRSKVEQLEGLLKKMSQGLSPEILEQLKDAKEQLRFNNQMMEDYSMSTKQKIMHEKQAESLFKRVDTSLPHLSNLNEDPQLSGRINYSLEGEVIKIGKRNMTPVNDIEMGGIGIKPLHAIIRLGEEEKRYIEPTEADQDSSIYINGDLINEETPLSHLDRLAFGTSNIFIVKLPGMETQGTIDQMSIDWEFAQKELFLKMELIEREQAEEKEKKMKEEAEMIVKEKENQLAELQKQLQQSELNKKSLEEKIEIEKLEIEKQVREEQAKKLKKEIEKEKKLMQDSQNQMHEKVKQKYLFEKDLTQALPKSIELNLIAKQFKRNIEMNVKMIMFDLDDYCGVETKKRSVKIKVINREAGYVYWWSLPKLYNRYFIIKDMSDNYFETGVVPTPAENEDPFWDPPEYSLIGRGFLATKALAYMFDNALKLPIIGEEDHGGELSTKIIPTDQTGVKNLSEEFDDDEQDNDVEPQYLLDEPFNFRIEISEASIPPNYSNIYVEYSIKMDEYTNETYKTPIIKEKTANPKFNYVKVHRYDNVTRHLLDYLLQAKIVFKIYGYEVFEEEKKQGKPREKQIETTTKKVEEKPKKKASEATKKKDGAKKTTASPEISVKSANKKNMIPQKKQDDKDCEIY